MSTTLIPKPLKIAQLNLENLATAYDQLLHYCLDNEIDIAILQEPYTNDDILIGLNTAPVRVFLSLEKGK